MFWFVLDKKIVPKGANDVKLINAGKVLENSKTVGQCRVPFGELPRGVITMHAVVQPCLAKAKTGSFLYRCIFYKFMYFKPFCRDYCVC